MGGYPGADPLMNWRAGWAVLGLGVACTQTPAEKPAHIVQDEADTSAPTEDTAEEDTGPADTDDPGPDTGMPTVTVERPAADLSADEVAAHVQAALALGIPDPLSARLAYINALENRDAFCPGGGDLSIIGEWDGCLAESGWRFAGYTEYTGPTDPSEVGDFHLLADFRFQDPEAQMFIGGGDLELTLTGEGSDRTWSSLVSGTFSYAGSEGWISSEGAGAILQTDGTWAGSVWSLALNGAINWGEEGVHFESVSADSESCDAQPTGRIGLRDPSGYWYAMDLVCGCGPVHFHETEDLGEACVNLRIPLDSLAMGMRP